MLDALKLIRALERASDQLFVDYSAEYTAAYDAWQNLIADQSNVLDRIIASDNQWGLPAWRDGTLGNTVPLQSCAQEYTVFAVDGSQIYPDRHHGAPCFLINTGTALVRYTTDETSSAFFETCPYIMVLSHQESDAMSSIEAVNLLREEFELRAIGDFGCSLAAQNTLLCLVDGTIVFWFLESRERAVRTALLARYLEPLERLYQARIWYAGYISTPRSRELVRLVQLYRADFDVQRSIQEYPMPTIVDIHLVRPLLQPYSRTTFFKSNTAICAEYPAHLQPYFCFVHVGSEIVRLEVPAWIAYDEQLCNQIGVLCIDQATKGNGYPVVLAEAHEQAVIKQADRELFYHALNKLLLAHEKRPCATSPKSVKKRRMGI